MASHSIKTLSDTTALLLSPKGRHSGTDITIQNINSEGYVYVGGSSELSSTNYGYRISPNNAVAFELPGGDSIYAISSIDEMQVAVLMTNLEYGA